ncbi:MAG: hypothetical protein IPL23_21140 [Saprospiraceae bacterium]|nr:hypothetical protein [Saprospiraceae bacterium]
MKGTHMFSLGVGDVTAANLQLISGPIQKNNMNTIANSDWSIGQFSTLSAELAGFADQLCPSGLISSTSMFG